MAFKDMASLVVRLAWELTLSATELRHALRYIQILIGGLWHHRGLPSEFSGLVLPCSRSPAAYPSPSTHHMWIRWECQSAASWMMCMGPKMDMWSELANQSSSLQFSVRIKGDQSWLFSQRCQAGQMKAWSCLEPSSSFPAPHLLAPSQEEEAIWWIRRHRHSEEKRWRLCLPEPCWTQDHLYKIAQHFCLPQLEVVSVTCRPESWWIWPLESDIPVCG